MRGRLNMSKSPGDYFSFVWVCVCRLFLLLSAESWGWASHTPLLLLSVLSTFVLLLFFGSVFKCRSFKSQLSPSNTAVPALGLLSACYSKQEDSLCSPVPLHGLNDIIFSLSSDSTAGFHLVYLLRRRRCLVSWIATVFSLSLSLCLLLSHSDTLIAVIVTSYLAQRTWVIVM